MVFACPHLSQRLRVQDEVGRVDPFLNGESLKRVKRVKRVAPRGVLAPGVTCAAGFAGVQIAAPRC